MFFKLHQSNSKTNFKMASKKNYNFKKNKGYSSEDEEDNFIIDNLVLSLMISDTSDLKEKEEIFSSESNSDEEDINEETDFFTKEKERYKENNISDEDLMYQYSNKIYFVVK
jgi:uncharacterized protein (UPF0305 family)